MLSGYSDQSSGELDVEELASFTAPEAAEMIAEHFALFRVVTN